MKRIQHTIQLVLASTLLILAIVMPSLIPHAGLGRNNSCGGIASPLPAGWFAPAPAIVISGDENWTKCPWVNGTGTWDNPYRISNLSISTDKAEDCILIQNTTKHFIVANCTLLSTSVYIGYGGIRLSNTSNGILMNNTCKGIYGSGISLSRASNNTLQGNNCSNSYEYGIMFSSSSNNTLAGNNCTNNGRYGISLLSSSNNTLTGNNCTGNAIFLQQSPCTTLSGNEMRNSSILLDGSLSDLFSTNIWIDNMVNGRPVRVYANKTSVIVDAYTGQAILINCSATTIEEFPNPGLALALCYSSNNLIRNNNCTTLYLFSATNNTLSGNNCTGNAGDGIYISSGSNNNTLSGNNCTGNAGDGIYISSASGNNTLSGNNCTGNAGDGIYLPSSVNNTLAENICTGNLGTGIGFWTAVNYTTFTRNTCTGNRYGISFPGGSYNTFTSNNCSNNTFYGIKMWGFWLSINNTFTENICSENIESGIQINSNTLTTGNHTFIKNTCTKNGGSGISLLWVGNNTLIENNCSENYGSGIFLECSNRNTLLTNICSWNERGIWLYESHNTTLTGNTFVKNTEDGIFLQQCRNATVRWNACTGNKRGINITNNGNNTLTGNTCSNNTETGILIYGAVYNALTGNTCSNNTETGILINIAGYNALTGNNCSTNTIGIDLRSSSNYNKLVINNCSENSVGITVSSGSKFNNLTINTCAGNTIGIAIDSASNNTLTGNNCSRNGNFGIQISASNATIISANTCAKNIFGVVLDATSYYNEIYQNWLKKNAVNAFTNDNPTNYVHDNYNITYPHASFTVNVTSLFTSEWVNFTDTSTSGDFDLEYQWNFEDVAANWTDQNVLHRYDVTGTWNAVLTIRDADGDLSVANQTIHVEENLFPVAFITPAPVSVALGTAVDLYATPGGNSPVTYRWDFGDGTAFGDDTHVTHLYAVLGSYTVTLNVTDANGDFVTTTTTVEVTNTPTWLEHLSPISVVKGTTGNRITWHALDPNTKTPIYAITRNNLTILGGHWTPNEAIVVDLDGLIEGTYTFTLTIIDGYGGIAIDSVMVTVTSESTSTGGIAGPSSATIILCIGVGAIGVALRKRRIR